MSIHVVCLWMCVLFYFFFVCLHVCAFAMKSMVHCWSDFKPGASGLPYYCTPPMYILLPQTLTMDSRPRPGPGDTRCTGEEHLPAIQTLGRVMPPSSHAQQPSQVCQFSLSPSWPRYSRCWAMPMPAPLRSLRHGKRSFGARLEIWRTLTNSVSTSRRR